MRSSVMWECSCWHVWDEEISYLIVREDHLSTSRLFARMSHHPIGYRLTSVDMRYPMTYLILSEMSTNLQRMGLGSNGEWTDISQLIFLVWQIRRTWKWRLTIGGWRLIYDMKNWKRKMKIEFILGSNKTYWVGWVTHAEIHEKGNDRRRRHSLIFW